MKVWHWLIAAGVVIAVGGWFFFGATIPSDAGVLGEFVTGFWRLMALVVGAVLVITGGVMGLIRWIRER